MTPGDLRADMEASYAIAKASDPTLRALLILVAEEQAKMIWCLAYATGCTDTYKRVSEMQRPA